MAATEEALPPQPPTSMPPRPQALMGVSLTKLENLLWGLFRQNKRDILLEEIRAYVGADHPNTLESIGRLCYTGLIECCAPGLYRLARDPESVFVSVGKRRIMAVPQRKMEQFNTARTIARTMAMADGTIRYNDFVNRMAALWERSVANVTLTLLDYQTEAGDTSTQSLRVLVRIEGEGPVKLLLTPEALSGCDYFVYQDPNRTRNTVIHQGNPLYEGYAALLRPKYLEAARFKGQVEAEAEAPPPQPAVVVAREPVAAPMPTKPLREEPVAATVVPDNPATELRLRREELIATQANVVEEERRIRAEAAELRSRADALLQKADHLAQEREAATTELTEVDADLTALDEIERQMADLATRRQALLNKHGA